MSDEAIAVEGALTMREGSFEDWYVIERARAGRLGDADVEGTAAEMLSIADAIERRGHYSAKRCAASHSSDDARGRGPRVSLWSPRNSQCVAWVPLAVADALAREIRATLAKPAADAPVRVNDAATWTTGAEGYQHDDERCAWQHATGLLGGSGDPSDVTPAMLERHVRALYRVVEAARTLRVAEREGRAARVAIVREELDGALAALPKEE